jgi:hypothetical protein
MTPHEQACDRRDRVRAVVALALHLRFDLDRFHAEPSHAAVADVVGAAARLANHILDTRTQVALAPVGGPFLQGDVR